ncbi:MAG: proton-conducting transporter membrane subunit [Planctomycetaceae bacterium]
MPVELRMLLPQAVTGLSACLLFVAGRCLKKSAWWGPFTLLALSASAACLAQVSTAASAPTQEVTLDPLSLAAQWAALAIGFLWTLASLGTLRANDHAADFFALMLMSVAGLMLVGAANDLIVLFVAIELACLPMTMVIWISRRDSAAREASTKYLLLSVLSSALLLFGFAFIYGLAGSTNLDQLAAVLSAGDTPIEPYVTADIVPRLGIVALVLTVAGLGFRLGVVPFHFGLRDVYAGTNAMSAALLAVAPRVAAVVVLVRLLIFAMARLAETGMLVLMVISGITMVVCSMAALTQTRVRPILAYTTMAHGGFAVMGLAVGFWNSAHPAESLAGPSSVPSGVSAALFFLAVYLISTLGLFAGLVYLSRPDRGIEYVEDLSGLLRSEPVAAIGMSVLLLSLIGAPPLGGFWGRTLVIGAALSVGGESPGSLDVGPNFGFLLLAAAAACYVVMTATVYVRMLVQVCFERQRARPRPGGGRGALACVVLAAALSILGGLWPAPMLDYLYRMQRSLERGGIQAATQARARSKIEPRGLAPRYPREMSRGLEARRERPARKSP